ncbi:MAG: aspartate aminotransferase family protein [Chloroflexota bacterium]
MQRALDFTDIAEAEDRYGIHLYNKRDVALVRGEGVYLWDSEGRRYLDMMSNFGVNILGHSHPDVTAAITEQASTLLSCHQSFFNDVRSRLVTVMAMLLPGSLQHLSFANSGAEAVEGAIKYARVATGRHRILSTKRGYHGRTLGALSVSGEQKHRTPFEPLLQGCESFAFGDLDAIRDHIEGAAAVIVEPIQGESGVRPASGEYLWGLRQVCDDANALLIFDEVQTAFRTGRTWAFEHIGVIPDIMTLSKPLANGLPMGLTVVSEKVAQAVPSGSHGTTFGGNPLVCAAALATLRIASAPEFNGHVSEVGAIFLDRLRSIESPLIRDVRGIGLMVAVELKRNASSVLRRMQEVGVLAIPAGSTAVRFLPPLIVQEEHVHGAAEALEEALRMSE